MANFINTVDVLGDEATLKAIVERTITEFKDDAVKKIDRYAFAYCTNLTSIDLPSVTILVSNAFENCSGLTTIILRGTTLCALDNKYVLYNTPFYTGGTGGTVYVPQALIESYQNATNWSTLYAQGTCNFVAIEGSEYE